MDFSNKLNGVKSSEDCCEDETPLRTESKQDVEMVPRSLEYGRGEFYRNAEVTEGQSGLGTSSSTSQTAVVDVEDQARGLFLCGIQAEKLGHLEKAISFYRRAVQLVPDIEFRIASYSDESLSEDSDDESLSVDNSSAGEDNECDNLVQKFQSIAVISGLSCICQPKHPQKSKHISILPPEILIYILKWVVSSELDLFSLEQVSKVCRGFYLCARDPEIWRLACLRIWGANVIDTPNRYGSWRNMFIQRPHLSFNGAYISRTTYIRYGEPSFQDANYRPCYLVEYYRYLRFFPEGLLLMLTTPDDPYQSLAKLRHREPKHQNILCGQYKLVGNNVLAVVKKPKRDPVPPAGYNIFRYRRQRALNHPEGFEPTFHLDLELRTVKSRYNCQLAWNRYSVRTQHRCGQETVSEFDITPSSFPPFWFSRVRSFSSESENPLK